MMDQESDAARRGRNPVRALVEWMRSIKRFVINVRCAKFVITLTFLCVLVSVSLGMVTFQANIANFGTLKVVGVSVFWDETCTNRVTSIDWGAIFPGSLIQKCFYVRSDGTATETLLMSYGNWTPAGASSYFVLTWNCSNYVLSPKALVCANLALAVQPNITGVTDFDFMILVQATG